MVKLSEVRVCLAVVNVPGSPVVLVIGGHVFRHVTRLGARVWRVAAENARDTRIPINIEHGNMLYNILNQLPNIGEILTKICLHTYFYIRCLFVFVRLANNLHDKFVFCLCPLCSGVGEIYLLVCDELMANTWRGNENVIHVTRAPWGEVIITN